MTTSLINLQALCDYFQCSNTQRATLLDNFLTDLTNGQTRIQAAWQQFSAVNHATTQVHALYPFKEAISQLKGCICQGHVPELNACCNQLYESVCQQVQTKAIEVATIAPLYQQLMAQIDAIFKEQFDHWLKDESGAAPETSTTMPVTTPSKLQLLVVEDHHAISRITVTLLKQVEADCDITLASSVAEAIQCCEQHSYDGVLLDLGLPDGDGIEIARALKTSRHLKNQQAPIIVSTAHANESMRQQCLAVGVQAVWIKPFTVQRAKNFIALCRHQHPEP
ncbi:MAG: response regulator [Gammaproteobacteria bacterium]|nr:response regulator [Gammaproteobacteria bacterium]